MFYELQEKKFNHFYSFLMSKHSFYNEHLNHMSLRVFESGIGNQHWKKMDTLNDITNDLTIKRINNEEYLFNLLL